MRAYAINSIGTSYGSEKTFTTFAKTVPVLTTTAITSITNNLAVSGGNISNDGGSAITFRGVCWDTLVNPTTGDPKTTDGIGTGNYKSNMSGLVPGKTYFARAYAINGIGTAYGNQISFIFDTSFTFVTIGTKAWQSKNLDLATYKNGDPIPEVTDQVQWKNLTTGAWCWHFNDSANYAFYGRKYNWYAVADPRGLCPAGWHVSSEADWTTLINHLGGPTVAGGALKSTTGDWLSPNVDATNVTGFTGLPSGFRNDQGFFSALGTGSQIWSSTESIYSSNPWYFWLVHNGGWILQYDNLPKANGMAVRCVKD